jgi:alpha-ketoglutarate-dependent taurine dioxygenase
MGDMLIWDNRSSLHRAGLEDCTPGQHRTMKRICIGGDRPF